MKRYLSDDARHHSVSRMAGTSDRVSDCMGISAQFHSPVGDEADSHEALTAISIELESDVSIVFGVPTMLAMISMGLSLSPRVHQVPKTLIQQHNHNSLKLNLKRPLSIFTFRLESDN